MRQNDFKPIVDIGSVKVGFDQPPLFLPDVGTFFNQDIGRAISMVQQLADGNVRAIKGEILHSADVCLDVADTVSYLNSSGQEVHERYRDLIERKIVSLADYEKIFAPARRHGCELIFSVYDTIGADFAIAIGASALKIATSNITHQALIENLAGRGLPLIMDTGASSMSEIARAVGWIHDSGGRDLILEHSPPPPPADVELHNLRFMQTLSAAFGTPFGLSDHHSGIEMALASVALGASVIEKGVHPSRNDSDQDVAHALLIDDAPQAVRQIDAVFRALGSGTQHLPRNRKKKLSRMGLVARKDIEAGGSIQEPEVGFAFPCKGVPAEHWGEMQFFRLRRSLNAGSPIAWEDLEPRAPTPARLP